ncbi:MAG TPA: protein translocase subunit SecF [Gemmatimonadaceae bacterium]|jgi:preprotein translocase subunit SecF
MLRILHDTKIDFIRWWRWAAGLTIAFIVIGLGSLALSGGFEYSVEFVGGTLMQLHFTQPPDPAKVRAALDAGGIKDPEIATFGTPSDFTVRARSDASAGAADSTSRRISAALGTAFGNDKFQVVRTEAVGPKVGSELRRGAVIAILVSFAVTLAYLAFRFDWRFGVAATIATMHDILTTIAFLKIMHLEISLTIVAALLTVIGYSLNDTIIIFDRVRENLRKNRREPLYNTLNRSVNETLPRSVLTHATALAATLALLFFAGEVIRPFAWVMAFGIITGTFSSVYVASPILLWIETKYPRENTAKAAKSAKPARAKTA